MLGESALGGTDEGAGTALGDFLSREPSPDEAAHFADEYTRLFDKLEDDTLKTIAHRRLEGDDSETIARALGVSTRTVDRKLRLIREIWSEEEVTA